MAVTLTARLGIPTWPLGTDQYLREQRNLHADRLELLTAIDRQGTLAERPAAGVRGTYYAPTDASVLGIVYRDDGGAWRTLGGVVDGLTSKPAAGLPGLKVQLAAGATGNALHVLNSAAGDVMLVDAGGNLRVAGDVQAGAGALYAQGSLTPTFYGATANIAPRTAGERGLAIRGRAGQSGNLFEVQANDGAILARLNNEGRLLVAPDAVAEATLAGLEVHPVSNGNPGLAIIGKPASVALVIKAGVAQTANLVELMNSGGFLVASIGANGDLSITTTAGANKQVQVGAADSGGAGFRALRVAN